MGELNLYEVVFEPLGALASELTARTVFGALCLAYRFLYGEDELFEFFDLVKKGKFFLSSPMPELRTGKKLFFTPVLEPPTEKSDELIKLRKKLKKYRFIPEDIFCELLEEMAKNSCDEGRLVELLFKKTEDKDSEEEEKISFKSYVSRVKLDLLTSTTGEGDFFFHPVTFYRSYLYVFVLSTQELWEKLSPAFRLLCEFGLGGDRSVGYGRVALKRIGEARGYENVLNFQSKDKKRFITLSPVLATKRINYEESLYELYTFKGALDSDYFYTSNSLKNIWKPRLFFLKEGSVIYLKEGAKEAGEFYEHNGTYTFGLEFPIYV